MMEIVWASSKTPEINAALGQFVMNLIPGCHRGFGDFVSFGVIDRGRLIAAVVYNNYFPEHGVIEYSVAAISKRWLTRNVIREMFDYPFKQLGCQMVVVRVAETNTGMAKICEDFGFNAYKIPRLHGRDEAEIIFTLTDDAWALHQANTSLEERLDRRKVTHG